MVLSELTGTRGTEREARYPVVRRGSREELSAKGRYAASPNVAARGSVTPERGTIDEASDWFIHSSDNIQPY
jgi:hypothetical protein